MKRDTLVLIGACVVGILLSIFVQSRTALQDANPLIFLCIGSAIALAILVLVTSINRLRVMELKKRNESVDFMVRPLKAAGYGLVLLLAFIGTIALAAMFKGDLTIAYGTRLTSLPIWAIGFATYITTYVNPRK